jgi:hypothetical protein
MANINKYGLNRSIPAEIKRLIRQKSKFGCVICRQAIYTYEHINPVFTEAKIHDPECMCLLCPNHQRDSTDGVLSKTEILNAYHRVQSSEGVDAPNRHGFFDLVGNQEASIQIGPTTFIGYPSIINIDGIDFLSFKRSSDKGHSFQINAKFFDNTGCELFRIKNNEWIGNNQFWDVDIVGTSLIIRRKKGEILFSVEKDLMINKLNITRLNMWALPFHIKTDKGHLLVGQHDLINKRYVYYGINAELSYGKCGLYLDSKTNSFLSVGPLKFYGGDSHISGTGIHIGRGGGTALIGSVTIVASNNCPRFIEFFPPKRKEAQLFVYGFLDIKVIQFPDWIEEEYYLYGLKLQSRPPSWGVIGKDKVGQEIELFHISGGEEAQLEKTPGFVGFWANDLLKKPWAEKVFECSVWEEEEPNRYAIRVKRCSIGNRQIESEINPETGQWFHPSEYAGVSVWKD